MTTLIILHEEMNDMMKIVKSIEECGLLIIGVSETIKNRTKNRKRRFLGKLLGTLGASLLVNLVTSKGTIRAGEVVIATSQGQSTIRASQNF